MNTQQFVVADAKGRVLLFTGKAKQGTPIIKSNFSFLQTTQPEPINCLLFSSSGRYLITGGASGELCVSCLILFTYSQILLIIFFRFLSNYRSHLVFNL